MLITNRHLKALLIPVTKTMFRKMEVFVTGKNLVKENYRKGYLKRKRDRIHAKSSTKYATTGWFPVDPEQKSLVASGDAYNRAVWQFRLKDGSILNDIPSAKKYRVQATKYFGLTFPKVVIPEDAVMARVFFAAKEDEETMPLGKRLQIEYGLLPTAFEPYEEEIIPIPKTKKDDMLLYYQEAWYLVKYKGDAKEVDWEGLVKQKDTRLLKMGAKKLECGCSVFLGERLRDGSVMPLARGGVASFFYEAASDLPKQDGIYGIRHSLEDSVPVCERAYDAVGLHFNYLLDNTMAAPYENDFDRIAPWCQIRRCAVSYKGGERRVIYEGDPRYKTTGKVGEIMVEIPKHYVKREIKDGYEEIAISSVPREGFMLDPSFRTKEGERDAIYIGAYFASVFLRGEEKVLGSRKNKQVAMYRTAEEFYRMAESNAGFKEIDLCAVLTVQRLFVVESALLDSKAVFEGNIYMPYMIYDRTSTYYSLDTEKQTNTIRLKDNSISRRFLIGDSVAVMNRWPDYFSKRFGNVNRVVTDREVRRDGTVRITFSGKPVDVTEQRTGISTLPEHTGGPDELPYHTAGSTKSLPVTGHDAFKYRWMENVWGGIWVVLDGCSIMDSKLKVEYPDGTVSEISYPLPVQNIELTSKQFGAPDKMCVKKMGYDPKNPLIALPEVIGEGAGTCGWYSGVWYSQAAPGQKYTLTYGGAWDNMAYAGIFTFRASFTPDQKIVFNGARLMCKF